MIALRDGLQGKPNVGAFPARDLLLIDIERVLGRLHAQQDAIAPNTGKAELSAACGERVKELEQRLATRRAAALAKK